MVEVDVNVVNGEYEAKRAGREYHNTEYLEDYSLILCNLSHFLLLLITKVVPKDPSIGGFNDPNDRPIMVNSACDRCRDNHENENNCPLPTSENCDRVDGNSNWRYWNNETNNGQGQYENWFRDSIKVECKGKFFSILGM